MSSSHYTTTTRTQAYTQQKTGLKNTLIPCQVVFLYKVILKTCTSTCVLVSKDALISVCSSMIMLFMVSQTLHRSPRIFCSSLFKTQ